MKTITVQKTWITEETFEVADDCDTNSEEFCLLVDSKANDASLAEWDFTTVLDSEGDELWNV